MSHDSILRRKGLQQFIKRIIESRIESFEPTFDAGGCRYPFVEEVLNTDSVDAFNVLEALAGLGVLEKQLLESTMTCPDCGNVYFSVKPVCPTCSSSRLLRGNVIEHLSCGYVDFEQQFYDKGFVCPRCDKELKALGVDYRRAGIFYKCISCGRVTALSIKRYVCTRCMRALSEDELVLKPVNRYVVVYDKLLKLYSGLADISPIISYLESKNYIVKTPVQITGSSGITHEFTLFVTKRGVSPSSGVIIDVVGLAEESKIYELFTKSFDVKAGATMLFVLGKVDEKTVKLAKTFNISVFEGESAEELLAKVRQPLEAVLNDLAKKQIADEVTHLEKVLQNLEKYGFG
ncbi:MAG: hypothetical protein QW064_03725 [Candidatus Caldarchaeum sp.]